MSQENQNEVKVEEKCKGTCSKILVIISLLLSISALVLSITAIRTVSPSAGAYADHEAPVVISKQYDKGRSIEKAMETKKPMIVFFYTDWCGYCQKFVPTYDKVTKHKDIKNDFAIAYVNCEDNKNTEHVKKYNVQAFPTVYVVKDGNKIHLDNAIFFGENAVNDIVSAALKAIK